MGSLRFEIYRQSSIFLLLTKIYFQLPNANMTTFYHSQLMFSPFDNSPNLLYTVLVGPNVTRLVQDPLAINTSTTDYIQLSVHNSTTKPPHLDTLGQVRYVIRLGLGFGLTQLSKRTFNNIVKALFIDPHLKGL